MQSLTFRLLVVSVTFFVSVFAVSIWLFESQNEFNKISVDSPTIIIETTTSDSIFSEEYGVYSAILADERNSDEVIVIHENTGQGLLADAANLNQEISDLTEYTINDYQTKKEVSQKLVNNFTVKNKVILLSEQEEKKLFRIGQYGWTQLGKKYPTAMVIYRFSRIGFNVSRTQALVSVSYWCGSLCGRGSFVFLQKEHGKWKISRNIGLFIS